MLSAGPQDVARIVRTHVTRHPPSDGAHRLAWWLAPRDERGFFTLARGTGISTATIDRLLAGEIEPDAPVAAAIARETEGDVLPEDWTRGGPLGWTDRPVFRPH